MPPFFEQFCGEFLRSHRGVYAVHGHNGQFDRGVGPQRSDFGIKTADCGVGEDTGGLET